MTTVLAGRRNCAAIRLYSPSSVRNCLSSLTSAFPVMARGAALAHDQPCIYSKHHDQQQHRDPHADQQHAVLA